MNALAASRASAGVACGRAARCNSCSPAPAFAATPTTTTTFAPRPPSLLLPRAPITSTKTTTSAPSLRRSRRAASLVTAAARKSATADAAAADGAPAALAARKRKASAKAAAEPPPPQQQEDDEDDEPTPAQVLAQVTRRIRDHGKAGRIRDAIAELASLSSKGLQPDRLAATALVAACAARPTPQNMTVAEGVFEELFGDGGDEEGEGDGEGPLLRPDEVTFAVLLRGYGAANPPLWPKIDATLGRMRRAFGIEPTATSYNALLEVCVRTGDMDRAMDVVDRMADDGVAPDAQTALVCARKRALRAYARKALVQEL